MISMAVQEAPRSSGAGAGDRLDGCVLEEGLVPDEDCHRDTASFPEAPGRHDGACELLAVAIDDHGEGTDVEAEFARSFELSVEVKVYAKLPSWFKIDTPLGSYNPDWAVLLERDGNERLYFVVETKANLFGDALRPVEQAKIDCGTAHFRALGNEVSFAKAKDYDTFIEQAV